MRCGGNIQVMNFSFFFFKFRILACDSESFQNTEIGKWAVKITSVAVIFFVTLLSNLPLIAIEFFKMLFCM